MKPEHSTLLMDYLKYSAITNKSPQTTSTYRYTLEQFTTWYESLYPDTTFTTATHQHITDYLYHLHQKAVATRRLHISVLKDFYAHLVELFHVEHNPVRKRLHTVKLKSIDQAHTVLLTPQDWVALQERTYRLKDRLIISLLYFGGLRLSELINLSATDFNSVDQTVRLIRKGGSVHRLKIEEFYHILNLLNEYVLRGTHTELRSSEVSLFSNSHGEPYTRRGMYGHIMRLIQKAQCPTKGLSPHSFRKACATNLYEKTKDLLLVRDYLNHSDAKVTQTYIER